MRQLWLEKLAADGVIRQEAVPHIYEEVKAFMKSAEMEFMGMTSEQVAKGLGMGLATAVGSMAGNKISEFISRKHSSAQGRDQISKNREAVMKQYKDPDDMAKAQARFDEMARYSPHAAMNMPLATKIVRSNLHSGISDETAQRLALMQSNYSSLKQQKELLPKTASIRPEALGEIIADFYIVEKTAAVSGKDMSRYLKTVATYASIPVVSGLVSGAASYVWDQAKKKDLQRSLNDSFNNAVKGAPETHKDIFMQDMGKTRQTFDALTHFAPQVALQPHAARTFMKKMLDYYEQGGMNVTDIKDLTEIEKNMSNAKKPSSFGRGYEAGAKFLSSGSMGKGIEAANADLMHIADSQETK